MARFQMDISKELLIEMDELKKYVGLATKKELINYALTVFKWTVQEVGKGNVIASVNEGEKKYTVLETPPFTQARAKAVGIHTSHDNTPLTNPSVEEKPDRPAVESVKTGNKVD